MLSMRKAQDKLAHAAAAGSALLLLAIIMGLLALLFMQAQPAWFSWDISINLKIPEVDNVSARRDIAKKIAADLSKESSAPAAEVLALLSPGAMAYLRNQLPENLGQQISLYVPLRADMQAYLAGKKSAISKEEQAHLHRLQSQQKIEHRFNTRLFTQSDSRDPALAGLFGAFIGTLLTLLICFAFALPVGVAAAIYFEEFAPRNQITLWLEALMNNLAAIPSIIYGLLGLALLIGFMGMPRASALVGGLVLGLMSLPIIVLATRAALRSVPQELRDAALALGCTPLQSLCNLVLPLARPGILSGTILSLAHAIGETAPLLLLGMVAFIVAAPASLLDPATLLPVQIYLWAERPERGFVSLTAASILLLLALITILNLAAILIRQRSRVQY